MADEEPSEELRMAAQFGQMLLAEQEKLKAALSDARDTETSLREQLQEMESEALSLRSRNTALQGKLEQFRNESLSLTASGESSAPSPAAVAREYRFAEDSLLSGSDRLDGESDAAGPSAETSAMAELERRHLESLVRELTTRNERLEGLLTESTLEQAAQVRLRHELSQSVSARQRSSAELKTQRTRRLSATHRGMSIGPGSSPGAAGSRQRAGSMGVPMLATVPSAEHPSEQFTEDLAEELHAQLAATAEDLANTEELFNEQGKVLQETGQRLRQAEAELKERDERLLEYEAAVAEQRELVEALRETVAELKLDNEDLTERAANVSTPTARPASASPDDLGQLLRDASADQRQEELRRVREELAAAQARADEMESAFSEVNEVLSTKAEEIFELQEQLKAPPTTVAKKQPESLWNVLVEEWSQKLTEVFQPSDDDDYEPPPAAASPTARASPSGRPAILDDQLQSFMG